MADKPKTPTRDRRQTIDALRRQQRAQERRKTLLVVGIAAVLSLGLIALTAIPAILNRGNDPANQGPASFGVAAAAASCDPEVTGAAVGVMDHVPEGTVVTYADNPPASGRHETAFLQGRRPFYEASDRPAVEKLVHSLEHGYTIVWYDSTITGDKLQALRDLSVRMTSPEEASTGGKFIVAPWTSADESRGKLPAGKHLALTHWGGNNKDYRQLCGDVSGEAIAAFTARHPASDAPEPNGG